MTDESRVRWLRRLARLRVIALSAFILGIAILAVMARVDSPSGRPDGSIIVVIITSMLMLLLSPFAYVFAIVARDILEGKQKWQFSLRALLLCMTVIAIGIGLLSLLLRN